MQKTTLKRLLGMDEAQKPVAHDENTRGLDGNVEKGPDTVEKVESESEYPPFKTAILAMACLYMATFLTALDRTIVGVAIPSISNEFKSFDQIAWYEAAFLLTFCVFQFPMGKVFTFYSPKWTYIALIAVFEIGSILCAAAPTSIAFIIGRAIAGAGGAGSMVGASVNMISLIPLRKRPKYQGFLGAVFGLASIIGPLVGGVFTTKASWRWCFGINGPIGVIALVGLVFFLPASKAPDELDGTFLERLWKFDPIGNLLLAPGIICILLALQWGGATYPWHDTRIIILLVIGVLAIISFAGVQYFQQNGTIPPRIIRQRSMTAGFFVSLGLGAALILPTFYIPIWFQAIKGLSAIQAGVRLIPLFLGTVFFVIGSGVAISASGYYTPWLVLGCMVQAVGMGLLSTLRPSSGAGAWIGFQIITGAGTGMTLQQCTIAAQTVLPKKDVPIGLTIIAFAQFFAGTVAVSIGQTVLSNTLSSDLAKALPNFDYSTISSSGATQFRGSVSAQDLPVLLMAYNRGIDNIFNVGLGASCLALIGSVFMEWKTVKKPQKN